MFIRIILEDTLGCVGFVRIDFDLNVAIAVSQGVDRYYAVVQLCDCIMCARLWTVPRCAGDFIFAMCKIWWRSSRTYWWKVRKCQAADLCWRWRWLGEDLSYSTATWSARCKMLALSRCTACCDGPYRQQCFRKKQFTHWMLCDYMAVSPEACLNTSAATYVLLFLRLAIVHGRFTRFERRELVIFRDPSPDALCEPSLQMDTV